MTEGDFKLKVFGPYQESWKLLALLQYCSKTNNHENWTKFGDEVDRFCKAADNPFKERLARFLLDAAEDIAAMNEGDKK
jgi:hypothetical protein